MDVVTIGGSYTDILQLYIICSPPQEVSEGTPRGHGSGRARGLQFEFVRSVDRARPHPPNSSFFPVSLLISNVYGDNGSALFPSGGWNKPQLTCTMSKFSYKLDKTPTSKSAIMNIIIIIINFNPK
jgi:hypothetical protein